MATHEDNVRVIETLQTEFPPDVPWNQTVWRREFGILKRTLLKQGYSHGDVCDAIRYAKLRGKRLYSLAYIPYIIEQSKIYWQQVRQRESERAKLTQKNTHADTPQHESKSSGIGWLDDDGFEEV